MRLSCSVIVLSFFPPVRIYLILPQHLVLSAPPVFSPVTRLAHRSSLTHWIKCTVTIKNSAAKLVTKTKQLEHIHVSQQNYCPFQYPLWTLIPEENINGNQWQGF